jgi:hypothetical protein
MATYTYDIEYELHFVLIKWIDGKVLRLEGNEALRFTEYHQFKKELRDDKIMEKLFGIGSDYHSAGEHPFRVF